MGALVSKRYATLYELQTVYSYEDALDLYEIALINAENYERAAEAAKRKAKHAR